MQTTLEKQIGQIGKRRLKPKGMRVPKFQSRKIRPECSGLYIMMVGKMLAEEIGSGLEL